MNKMIKYGKTTDFRSFVKTVQHICRFEGLDDNGEVIYNNNPLPTLKLVGTTKLHGSNFGMSLQNDELVLLSRNRVLGAAGHFGMCEVAYAEKEHILPMFDWVKQNSDWQEGEIITIYGEVVGPGIQNGVAICEIPQKCCFIFAAKITREGENQDEGRYITNIQDLKCSSGRFHNIHEYKTWELEIDMDHPEKYQNQIVEWTEEVDKECPVAKEFGKIGHGEGIVFETFLKDRRLNFKSKGESHSSSRVKKLANLDPEILKSIEDFVEYSCTINRMEQCIHEVGQEVDDIWDKRYTGKLVNWIKSDIVSEELDALNASNLEFKQVAGPIGKKMSKYYFEKMAEQVGV